MPNVLQAMRVASGISDGHSASCRVRNATESTVGFGSNTGSREAPSLTAVLSSLFL